MATLETQYKNWKEQNVSSLYTFEQWKEKVFTPMISGALNILKEKDYTSNTHTLLSDCIIVNGNNYYTPDIEEFYVGYKYEIRFKEIEIWEEAIFKTTNDLQYLIEIAEGSIGDKGGIRTKYLDKEDIESLGWVYLEQQGQYRDTLDFVKRVDRNKIKETTLYKYDIYLQYNFKLNELDIYNDDDLAFENYFQGTGKSINELKTIMKLLNIQ